MLWITGENEKVDVRDMEIMIMILSSRQIIIIEKCQYFLEERW